MLDGEGLGVHGEPIQTSRTVTRTHFPSYEVRNPGMLASRLLTVSFGKRTRAPRLSQLHYASADTRLRDPDKFTADTIAAYTAAGAPSRLQCGYATSTAAAARYLSSGAAGAGGRSGVLTGGKSYIFMWCTVQ